MLRKADGETRLVKFKEHSFEECVEQDENLRALRKEHANRPAQQRRIAADWEYHSSIAGRAFDDALARMGQVGLPEYGWPDGVLALAIDPLYPPAILTVASYEYQLGRKQEAMDLFMQLTTLSPDESDLAVIIDEAVAFLLDEEDYENARDLYAAAETA